MTVTIFSTTSCPSCAMVKKFLSKNNVQYSEVNIETNPEAAKTAQRLSGALTVPVTLIEDAGKQSVIIGFNPSKLATI